MGIHFRLEPLSCARHARASAAPPHADARAPTLVGLQYLRGFAAIGVVLFHASQSAGFAIAAGAFGVDIFFVLSGFLMTLITNERSRPWPFLRERLLRIVPPYWIATIAALWLGIAGIFWTPSLMQAAASFAFIPYGGPGHAPYFYPVLTIGWTLNYEMLFYCVFAGTLFLPHAARLPALSGVLLGLVGARIAFTPSAPPLIFWSDPLILEFLAGAWAGALWRREGPYRPRAGWGLIAAAAAAYWLISQPFPILPSALDSRLPLVVPALLLLFAMLYFERRPGGMLRIRGAGLLGDASYSIYLWHIFAIGFVSLAARALGLPPWTIFPLGTAAGILAGLAAYGAIEAPLLARHRTARLRKLSRADRSLSWG